MPTVNWSHPLLSGALDVIWSGKAALTAVGTLPTTTDLAIHPDIDALGGGNATSGHRQAGVPGFVGHAGDMTITVVAMAHNATKGAGPLAGYDYFTGSTYGTFALYINERRTGDIEQRGALRVVYQPLRNGYADAVSIGSPYLADLTNMPFYTANQLNCISFAFTAASASDLRTVVNGTTRATGYERATAMPTGGGSTAFSGIGLGGRHVGSSNAMQGVGGSGSVALIIVHNRKLSEAEQQSLTADPWQIFSGMGGGTDLTLADSTHAHTADNIALSVLGTLVVQDATHAHSADNITLTATANGTITIPAVRDWETGNLKTGQTGVQVDIRNIATGALVVRKTGQTTHATTGVCVVTDALIIAGTTYEVVTRFADGSRGMWDYLAS